MTTAAERSYPFPRWYLVLSAVVGVIAAAGLVLGVIGVYVNTQQDATAEAANRARDAENSRLLKCFDEYAAESSQVSIAVRVASVRKDKATGLRDDALRDEGGAFLQLVNHILDDAVTPVDVKRLRATLEDRAHAADALDRAQAALDKAREDNPVPPAPSVFCGADEAEKTQPPAKP